jgi:hypothetical protein
MLKLCTIRREDFFPAKAVGLIENDTKIQTVGSVWLTIFFTTEQIASWIGMGYAIDVR